MATISTKKSSISKLFKKAACVAALAAGSVAQAGVIDFESGFTDPILYNQGYYEGSKYWVETYAVGATSTSDLAGVIVDGSDNGLCVSGGCPVNNQTNYYTGLNDGYMYFGQTDGKKFRLTSLQASWIATDGATRPGVIRLQGFDAKGLALGGSLDIPLAGATGGLFSFSTYSLAQLSSYDFTFVRILGFGCDATNTCYNGQGLSNFAIDNIVTFNVPEPASIALIGLGLAGIGAMRRRRRAA